MIRFLLLNVSSPFMLGVYDSDVLLKEYNVEGKASDVLPLILDEALSVFVPDELYYTNGPGNHMSLKIAYVCLKSVSVIKQIPLYGLSPFLFNGEKPIKAFGNSYFVQTPAKIELTVFETPVACGALTLPKTLDFMAQRGFDEPLFLLAPA